MKIYSICCTYNRHRLLERSVGCFLAQDYEDKHLLIYNNSPEKLRMDRNYKNIWLINNHISTKTGRPYENTGDIFSDALWCIPSDVDIIHFWDDDDEYLPSHISEGVKGMQEAIEMGKKAYKPKYSYFRYQKEPQRLADNLMEPSIFVLKEWVEAYGFSEHSSAYHSPWTSALFKHKKIHVKEKGEPTFIYDWSDEAQAFKISGAGHNPDNFQNHKENSKDVGDGIITPINYVTYE